MENDPITFDFARQLLCEAIDELHTEDECHPVKIPIADAIRIYDNLGIDFHDLAEACSLAIQKYDNGSDLGDVMALMRECLPNAQISGGTSSAESDCWTNNKRKMDMKNLPTAEEAGAIAVEISEKLSESLDAREQAFFVAGFQEAIKYLMSNTPFRKPACNNDLDCLQENQ